MIKEIGEMNRIYFVRDTEGGVITDKIEARKKEGEWLESQNVLCIGLC
jgi:hypothetical protein